MSAPRRWVGLGVALIAFLLGLSLGLWLGR